MSKIVDANKKIEKAVIDGYKKVENLVVTGYQKIEDKFVDAFLKQDGETIEETKIRVKKEQEKLEEQNKFKIWHFLKKNEKLNNE